MKEIIYCLLAILPLIGFASCDNDEPKEHNCKLPLHKSFVESVTKNGVIYELYSCVPYYYAEGVNLAVMIDYAFINYVESAPNELVFDNSITQNKIVNGNEYPIDYDISYISSDAFTELNNLQSVTFPVTLYEIYGDSKLFNSTPNLTDIYCFGEPIEVESGDLGCDYNKVQLHIKKGSKKDWESVSPWNNFKNIVEDL